MFCLSCLEPDYTVLRSGVSINMHSGEASEVLWAHTVLIWRMLVLSGDAFHHSGLLRISRHHVRLDRGRFSCHGHTALLKRSSAQ